MSVLYFTHFHKESFAHFQCLRSSIRRFDTESTLFGVFEEWEDCERLLPDESFWKMSFVEECCRKAGIDWGAFRGKVSSRDLSWRMQAVLPWYLMCCEAFKEYEFLVYFDSDTYWFAPFRPIIDALPKTAHVGICRHFYPPGKENLSAGVYNNGVVLWRNSDLSREHAKRWALETLERWQPGHPRAVDHEQKLLDEWPEQLGEACVDLPPEVDWGPWRRNVIVEIGGVTILPLTGSYAPPLQSTHFHEFRRGIGRNPVTINGQSWNRCNYDVPPETIESIYKVYEAEIAKYV